MSIIDDIIAVITEAGTDEQKMDLINEIREAINGASPVKSQPVDMVRWVTLDMVQPNEYNPNKVANKEMGLLYHSIKMDGYTQPIVTIWDPIKKKYVIVDGFHRYFVALHKPDILEQTHGRPPIVVIDKDINERRASTVRHNRARGEHTVAGMSQLVLEMLEDGWTDAEICTHLGLEPDELLKLKHITGFSKLFEDMEYQKSWKTKNMIRIEKTYQKDG